MALLAMIIYTVCLYVVTIRVHIIVTFSNRNCGGLEKLGIDVRSKPVKIYEKTHIAFSTMGKLLFL